MARQAAAHGVRVGEGGRNTGSRIYPWGFSFDANDDQDLLNSYYFRLEGIKLVGSLPKGASPYRA